jgi:hypothetical protein
MVFVFCLNQFVDGGARKLFEVEGQGLLWGNNKWFDEDDVV